MILGFLIIGANYIGFKPVNQEMLPVENETMKNETIDQNIILNGTHYKEYNLIVQS